MSSKLSAMDPYNRDSYGQIYVAGQDLFLITQTIFRAILFPSLRTALEILHQPSFSRKNPYQQNPPLLYHASRRF